MAWGKGGTENKRTRLLADCIVMNRRMNESRSSRTFINIETPNISVVTNRKTKHSTAALLPLSSDHASIWFCDTRNTSPPRRLQSCLSHVSVRITIRIGNPLSEFHFHRCTNLPSPARRFTLLLFRLMAQKQLRNHSSSLARSHVLFHSTNEVF